MSIKEFSRYLKAKKAEGIIIKPYLNQDDFLNPAFAAAVEPPRIQSADVIEDKDFQVKTVNNDEEKSGFSYFLDGIERKVTLNDMNRFFPLIYGYVSAVIIKRTDKKLHSIGYEDKSEKIYLPYKEEPDAPENYFDLSEFKDYKFKIANSGKKDELGKYPVFPKEFEQRAHSDIQETRGKLERSLALKWLNQNNDNGWLFVDGRLENKNAELLSSAKIAGIIKSHHVYYFSPEDQNKIFSLEKGQRTSVFQPKRKDGRPENIFSWYLRLHKNTYTGNIDFGIIRVEIPAKEELLKQVDKISKWILLETNPIAFPASRWDRMIYPIKYCEEYLRSKAPSWAMIESL